MVSPACRRDTLPLALAAADVMGRFGGPLAKTRTANRRRAIDATEVFCTVIPIYLNGGEVLCTEHSAVPGTIVRRDGWRRMGKGWQL